MLELMRPCGPPMISAVEGRAAGDWVLGLALVARWGHPTVEVAVAVPIRPISIVIRIVFAGSTNFGRAQCQQWKNSCDVGMPLAARR